MRHVRCKSGLKGWQDHLRSNYEGKFEQFEAYDRIYGLAARLGYASASEAWEANPIVQGSTNPEDFRVVKR